MNDKIVKKKRSTPNIPETKNQINDILAAFFSPKDVAYVLTPWDLSPLASTIPSAKSCALSAT